MRKITRGVVLDQESIRCEHGAKLTTTFPVKVSVKKQLTSNAHISFQKGNVKKWIFMKKL